jgi:nicotinate-nucleotide pyrophosphorylase
MNKKLADASAAEKNHEIQFQEIDSLLTDIINDLSSQKAVKIERRELKTLRAALAALNRRILLSQKKDAA